MPATNLAEAMNLFDPFRPMKPDELDKYYVKRPHAPLEELKTYLRYATQNIKVLFSGHRGSGKSTELLRLAKDLDGEFFTVRVSAANLLNLADINYADVVLACAAALFRQVTDKTKGVKLPASLLKDALNLLTNEITTETTISVPKSGAISAKLNALIFSIEGKYGAEAVTRENIREKLFPRITELIEQFNRICEEVYNVAGSHPLIIIEDLDKVDIAHGRALFFDHATTLNSPACRIIYTFPIALCYENQFTQRLGDYSRHFLLPNVSVYEMNDAPNPEGRAALRDVMERRASPKLFGGTALDDIIELSGGLMRDLVRLANNAALATLTEGKGVITPETVRQLAAEAGNDFRRLLKADHYDELRKAHRTKQVTPNEIIQKLLENLSLLEYRNTVAWWDAHPIVRPLLASASQE